jgi:hypothetical protein
MGRDTAGRSIVKTREPFRCVPTDNGDTLQEEFAVNGLHKPTLSRIHGRERSWLCVDCVNHG